MTTTFRWALPLFLWFTITPTAARGQTPNAGSRAQAKALYERGVAAYKARDYDRAIRAFEDSHSLVQEPLLLFNIGQSYRLKGNCEKAVDYYQRYKTALGNERPTDGYAKAVDKCKEALARTATAKDAAQKRSEPDKLESNTAAPSSPAVSQTPPSTVDVETQASTGNGTTARTAGIVIAGAGIVTTAVGVGLSVRARSQRKDIEGHQGAWTPDLQGKLDAQHRDRILGPVLIGSGVAAVAGGAILYFVIGRPHELGIAPTGSGALMSWSSTF